MAVRVGVPRRHAWVKRSLGAVRVDRGRPSATYRSTAVDAGRFVCRRAQDRRRALTPNGCLGAEETLMDDHPMNRIHVLGLVLGARIAVSAGLAQELLRQHAVSDRQGLVR